jgi:hypothetical protein
MYTCPVCGYNALPSPPENFAICPSCYTEFGYDDATLSHEELRREWIRNGMRWEASNITPPPLGWNPFTQLMEAGFIKYEPAVPESEPKVSTVDLGVGVIHISSGSFSAQVKTRIVALGRTVPSLFSNIHPTRAQV